MRKKMVTKANETEKKVAVEGNKFSSRLFTICIFSCKWTRQNIVSILMEQKPSTQLRQSLLEFKFFAKRKKSQRFQIFLISENDM